MHLTIRKADIRGYDCAFVPIADIVLANPTKVRLRPIFATYRQRTSAGHLSAIVDKPRFWPARFVRL